MHEACQDRLTDARREEIPAPSALHTCATNRYIITKYGRLLMSLRRRLLAIIALVLLASLLGGGALTYWHGNRKIALEMSSAISVGDNAVRDALLPLLPGPITDSQLARIVTSFDGDRHLRAQHIEPSGNVALQSRVQPPSNAAPNWLVKLLAAPPHTAVLELPDDRGKIVLRSDPLNEITEVWDDAKLKLAIVGGFCTLILALISMTLSRALKPLEELSQALQQVGAGDYEAHVSESGPEELAAIYKGFNTMATRLHEAERKNRQLNEQLNSLQDEERAEIARDLHDEVGPFLFAVDVDAQSIPALIARTENDDVIHRASAIRQSVAHMQTHLKSVLSRLRPGTMIDLGLAHAAGQIAAFWHARYPEIAFHIDCIDESFGARIDETAFRVLQEGTSNAIRHGKPKHIWLSTQKREDGILSVTVIDDGKGLSTATRNGFGLSGMNDRLERIGGRLSVAPGTDGRGVTLRADIPFNETTLNTPIPSKITETLR
jgi:two-component system, NarL family, sensor histidine kinase UhpB